MMMLRKNMYFKNIKYLFVLIYILISHSIANNVIVVVIDGARYSETFGKEDTYIPYMWNEMRPQGVIFTNFYNDGTTKTNPGHATIATGKWQSIANNGTERPTFPTLFEYYRQQTGAADSSVYVVAGADKLAAISYSTYSGYGSKFGSRSITNNYTGDLITYKNLMSVMDEIHPSLMMVNFKQVDKIGHSGNWQGYLDAITQVDSLIYRLWLKINDDPFYKNNTTLIITNDHGRHDDGHGGFTSHGDGCEGCRHIMCLAIGNHIAQNLIITEKHTQIDIAPTVADLLSISSTYSEGNSFIDLISTHIGYTYLHSEGDIGRNKLLWHIDAPNDLSGFIIQRSNKQTGPYHIISSFQYESDLRYKNYSTSDSGYIYSDYDVTYGANYWYKIVASDSGRIQTESIPLFATPTKNEEIYSLIDEDIYKMKYTLKQNYPNPFNPSTTISFSIPKAEYVTLEIYDMLGQKIETLIAKELNRGHYQINWTTNNLSAGTYIYRLQVGEFQITKKMMLLE
jgi:hypothetical protein